MKTRHAAFIAFCGLMAMASLLTAFQASADENRTPNNAVEMVAAAKEALRGTMAAHLASRATIEDIYQWSRRLMQAEQRAGSADAAAAHLERMRTLHQKQAALFAEKAKGASSDKLYASKFYLLEAEANAVK